MRIITKMISKTTDLYEKLSVLSKEEWKELAVAFFEDIFPDEKTKVERKRIKEEAKDKIKMGKTIAALLEGVDEKEKPIYKALLENQYKYDKEHELCKDIPTLPIVRQALDRLTAKELVGVQPMSGPVSLLYKLRWNKKQKEDDSLSLEVQKQAVEAYSRKLKAGWSLEASQDLKALHNFDFEAELSQAMATEIATELNRDVVKFLSLLANKQEVEIKDDKELLIRINEAANEIGANTRRGCGNWIVMSPTMFGRFSAAAGHLFEPIKVQGLKISSMVETGRFNKTIRVFSDLYMEDDALLVGYKGSSGAIDSGAIYTPYVIMMPTGPVTDPNTYQPVTRFMTRGNTMTDEDSHDYYELITIKNQEDKDDV